MPPTCLLVKEQCLVLFPYTALNDDELSLAEGQVINIVAREVEDKGWWKGELDGKVGVFPDNFVKVIAPGHHATSAAAHQAKEEQVRIPALISVCYSNTWRA